MRWQFIIYVCEFYFTCKHTSHLQYSVCKVWGRIHMELCNEIQFLSKLILS